MVGAAMILTEKRKLSMEQQEAMNVARLTRSLKAMYHENGSEEAICEWHNKQKDFWGGVGAIKKLLWPLGEAMGPLEGLYRTHDLRLVCKQIMGEKASISKAQLAVALVEMGFVVLFTDEHKFHTNFPCKRVVAQLKNEGMV